jgi:hypothetical protein
MSNAPSIMGTPRFRKSGEAPHHISTVLSFALTKRHERIEAYKLSAFCSAHLPLSGVRDRARNNMANYYATARSNYFRVKDVEVFTAWCDRRNLNVWTKDDRYAISPNSEAGWPHADIDTDDEYFEIDLYEELSQHLDPRDIAVLMQIGWEKLRYFTGEAIAIRSSGETCRISLDDIYTMAIETFHDDFLTITEVAY